MRHEPIDVDGVELWVLDPDENPNPSKEQKCQILVGRSRCYNGIALNKNKRQMIRLRDAMTEIIRQMD